MTFETAIDLASDLYAWGDDAMLAEAVRLTGSAQLQEYREACVAYCDPVYTEWYVHRSLGSYRGSHPGCSDSGEHYHPYGDLRRAS